MNEYLNILKENGLKITPLRKGILEVFQKKKQSLTAEDMCRRIRQQIPRAGLQSIYRNLADFVKAGIAEEIYQRRKSFYTLCDGMRDHHHHAVCRRCGHSEEIKACSVFQSTKKKNGFHVERHFLQLEGLCYDCQKQK